MNMNYKMDCVYLSYQNQDFKNVCYTTQFGSLDSRFKPLGKDEFVTVPDGVAHFLEHKLFEKKKKIYSLHLLRKMHKPMLLLVLTAQVIYLVRQIILRIISNGY